ncbi:hypothetical protein A0H81_07135 [Grifola frondosa]|uniref:Uncharacterized protein n=1 Tax=Grifola frondosa TaxID=5627 RepID=A0A1C7M8W7_GRIFR|nr:hypothetical protein A0H81_07135 [Grifola frondosa]
MSNNPRPISQHLFQFDLFRSSYGRTGALSRKDSRGSAASITVGCTHPSIVSQLERNSLSSEHPRRRGRRTVAFAANRILVTKLTRLGILVSSTGQCENLFDSLEVHKLWPWVVHMVAHSVQPSVAVIVSVGLEMTLDCSSAVLYPFYPTLQILHSTIVTNCIAIPREGRVRSYTLLLVDARRAFAAPQPGAPPLLHVPGE